MRHRILPGLLLCCAWAAAGAEAPLPSPIPERFNDLNLSGSGELRWFGLKLYRASLWQDASGTRVLDIQYARGFSRGQLVEASVSEMRRLGADESALARWSEEMTRVFPDVEAGDRLIGVHRPGAGAIFYTTDGLAGEILDPGFAERFFAIWLDPRTRNPELRAELLGRE